MIDECINKYTRLYSKRDIDTGKGEKIRNCTRETHRNKPF